MKIQKSILEEICRTAPERFPEEGGLLGGQSNVIRTYFSDRGMPSDRPCSYTPNVELLNDCIAEWEEQGIEFYGIYHTHFFGVEVLSDGDLRYIRQIMQAMPDEVTQLAFPLIVLPERRMVGYLAEREGERITIRKEEMGEIG